MNEFSIYCTREQTKKALELGAPIYTSPYFEQLKYEMRIFFVKDGLCYWYPTAEQMISWLEENNIETIIVCKKDGGDYGYTVYHTSHRSPLQHFGFSSRKEATLAAIDAALEYLTQNKK